MAGKTISGIGGVLGDLISPAVTPAASPRLEQPPAGDRKAGNTGTPKPPAASRPRRARLGRPLESSLRPTDRKEKVTLRVSSDLIAEYRNWSWEARCQLSELVERALRTYLESRTAS
jgi:uncharacterized protein (DUF4415 family)